MTDDKSELREKIKTIVHRRKYTCTIPNEDFDEIISLFEHSKQSEQINDKNIRKALAVLKSGTTNPIIISDMANVLEREYSHMETLIDTQSTHVEELLSEQSEWQPIESAPKDGSSVLLKFKNDMSQFDKGDKFNMKRWNGLCFVGRNRGDVMLWGFAAPVGTGGFPDEWLDGWQPLPSSLEPIEGEV